MKVVYACDDNYAVLTAVSATSLLKHNPGCEVVLVGCRLNEASVGTVRKSVDS